MWAGNLQECEGGNPKVMISKAKGWLHSASLI